MKVRISSDKHNNNISNVVTKGATFVPSSVFSCQIAFLFIKLFNASISKNLIVKKGVNGNFEGVDLKFLLSSLNVLFGNHILKKMLRAWICIDATFKHKIGNMGNTSRWYQITQCQIFTKPIREIWQYHVSWNINSAFCNILIPDAVLPISFIQLCTLVNEIPPC